MAGQLEPDFQRLGALVRRRREALRFSQRAIAAEAKLSPTTWAQVESGAGPRPRGLTAAAIERALQWPEGAIDRILAGGEPEESAGRPAALSGIDLPDDLTDDERLALQTVIDGIRARREQRS